MTSSLPHVVMLTNAVAPDKLGGLERYVRELSRGLVAAGASVTVVAKRTAADQPEDERGTDGVRIRRYSPPPKTDPLFALRYPHVIVSGVRAHLDRARADGHGRPAILHGHFPVPLLGLARTRQTYVYTCHAPVHRELLSERRESYALPRPVRATAVAGLRGTERLVLRRAHTLVTLSTFVRDEVAALDRRCGERVQPIPGGLDTDWFRPAAVPPPPLDPRAPVLFTARRLVERTGVDALVEAMPAVLAQAPGARLDIAGTGPLAPSLERRIIELGLGGHVHLLGRLSETDLRDHYRRADLAITPTRAMEGFGLSTAEALACGTLAVVSPVGANPEVVSGLSPTLVARSSSPPDLAAAITSVLRSPDLDALRARTRSHVHPRWAWHAVVDDHLALYDRVPVAR
ncbi:glycosyltransferase family 4 protein [Microbacterium sp. NPDC090007]|uniref:glycosyltransferase family 4 protein n=1 Tax=Microbacterium sp. NPDC090007 TaxID=3364204 RepID=UPI0037F307A3